MSLNVCLEIDTGNGHKVEAFWGNITHNLGKMASMADLYYPLWRPEEYHEGPLVYAKDLVPVLEKGLKTLITDREYFEGFNPSNGWGDYDGFVQFVKEYLDACKDNPNCTIAAYR